MRFFSSFPRFVFRPLYALDERLAKVPIVTLLTGGIGLILGLAVAVLLSSTIPFDRIPGPAGVILPTFLTLVLGYLGLHLFLRKQAEFSQFFARPQQLAKPSQEEPPKPQEPPRPKEPQCLIDTSAIIDGRIADIVSSGFLPDTMVIPQFVLQELRHIADSSDFLRRNQGRHGFEMLKKLGETVSILDVAKLEGREVDEELVRLARTKQLTLVTTDYNLQQVAELAGVKVLNINALAVALRPVFHRGEVIQIKVVQEGSESGQGVGFLDDGTMVIIDGGRRWIGQSVYVEVQRPVQTLTGLIIFAQYRG